ncbi:RagB/SusD family nutrient uptake outer membrane protein [Labilibacter sediminis]|nr:RagB/SusD family nutrient uptake outer membrane protein [Labilibacter sediminis]
MKHFKYILILMAVLLLTVTACHDDLEQFPNSSYTSDDFFNNLGEFEIAVNGIYNTMTPAKGVFGEEFIKLSMHGSHSVTTFHANAIQNQYGQFTFDNSDKGLYNIWQTNYTMIARANQVLSRFDGFQVDSAKDIRLKQRLKGEAKFLRALGYFNLVRFWGRVPIILDEFKYDSESNNPRMPIKDVYDVIIEDLEYAEDSLYHAHFSPASEKYPESDLGRATVGAAKALLAKVYLTMAGAPLNMTEYYQDAYDKALEVKNDGEYALESNYGSLFTIEGEKSKEWIFQVQHNYDFLRGGVWGGVNGPAGNSAAIDKSFARTNPTLNLIESYDYRDPRFIHNIAPGILNADNSIKYNKLHKKWYPHKFRFSVKPVAGFKTDMNVPVLRYADVILILAEAAANIGLETEAYDALDMIISRAQSGTAYPALVDRTLTADDLDYFIMWERARELCFEGHGKFDIFRYGQEVFEREVIGQQEATFDPKPSVDDEGYNYYPIANTKTVKWNNRIVTPMHLLYPIPEAEMSTNSAVADDQNPGYN